MTDIIQHTTIEQARVPLIDLKSLKSTTFNLPKHATRELDPKHVQELSASVMFEGPNGNRVVTTFPDIKVVDTNEGPVIIDGYHRIAAIQRKLLLDILGLDNEETSVAKQDKALKAPLDETSQTRLNDALNQTYVAIEIGIYKREKDVALAALTANLTHGLAPQGKSRVHLALEYYDLTRDDEKPVKQSEVARIFGISRATLNEYLKAREKEQGTETSEDTAKEETSKEEKAQPTTGEKFHKKLDAVLKELTGDLYQEDEQAYIAAIHKLVSPVITSLADIYLEKTDQQYADDICTDLGIGFGVQPEHLKYLHRLSTVFGIAHTTRTKKPVKVVKASSKGKVTLDNSDNQEAQTPIDTTA